MPDTEMYIRLHNKKEFKLLPFEETPEYKEYRKRWLENPLKRIAGDFPIHMDIESTSVCNLRCITCFQAYTDIPKGFMDMVLYKKIIDEAAEKGLCSMKLNYRGEPLLHPKIADMVKYAKDKGIMEVMFNSNCTKLTEEKCHQLIDAGLDKLICSVDGYTKEVYEKIRVGGRFETVLNNIKNLQRIKKERGVQKPITRVQMVESPANTHQVANFLNFWDKLIDRASVTDMMDWTNKNPDKYLVSKQFVCPKIYQRMSVLSDGKVAICDGNYYVKLIAGDVSKQSIEEVWNGPVMKKLRDLSTSGNSHKSRICAECGYRKLMIKNEKLDSGLIPIEDPPYEI